MFYRRNKCCLFIIYINTNSGIEEKLIITQEGTKPKADITINVTEPGTLSAYIESERISTLTSLKIVGDLNGDDLMCILRMNSLKILDLSETKIVAGGEEWKTLDNSLSGIVDNWGNVKYGIVPRSVEYVYLPNGLIELRGFYKERYSSYFGDSFDYYSVFGSYCHLGIGVTGCNRSSLRYVELPNSLQKIMDASFMGTNLTEFVIPENVDSIGDYAFFNCDSLVNFVSNSTM